MESVGGSRGREVVVRGVAVKAGGEVEEEGRGDSCEDVPVVGRALARRPTGGGRTVEAVTERATTVAVTAGTPLIASAPRGPVRGRGWGSGRGKPVMVGGDVLSLRGGGAPVRSPELSWEKMVSGRMAGGRAGAS